MGFFKKKADPVPDSSAPAAPQAQQTVQPGGIDLEAMQRQGTELSQTVRRQGFTKSNVGDLLNYARDAQAQAQAQAQATKGRSPSAALRRGQVARRPDGVAPRG